MCISAPPSKTASGLYEMCGISQNVTSLARARDAANINAQRLRLALNAAGAGVFEYDYASERFWFSPELQAMVGAELVDSELNDPVGLFHPDDQPEVARLRAAAGAARTEVRSRRACCSRAACSGLGSISRSNAASMASRSAASAWCSTSTPINARSWR